MAIINASGFTGTGGPQGFGMTDTIVMVHTATATYDLNSTVTFKIPKPQGTKILAANASLQRAAVAGAGVYSMVKNIKVDDANSKIVVTLGTAVTTNDLVTAVAYIVSA